MEKRLMSEWTMAFILLAGVGAWNLAAQERPVPNSAASGTTATAIATANTTAVTGEEGAVAAEPARPPAKGAGLVPEEKPKYSAGVEEVLRMTRAGVSAEVMKTYVEHSPIAYELSAVDIIALKEQHVPDEVVVGLLKRGAELTAQVNQVNGGGPIPSGFPVAVAPAKTVNREVLERSLRSRSGPESYDFWYYHYAYPRALASANERLSSSYAGFGGGPYYPAYRPYGFGSGFGAGRQFNRP